MARTVSLLALLLALVTTSAQVDAQSGYDLFQKALATERADGNLRAAIQLYERVVTEFPRDRAVVAQALVRMAECHEKLGDGNARRVYERVARDYADQSESVAIARSRLAALGAGVPAVTGAGAPQSRQLWTYAGPVWSASPDGRYLAFGQLNNLFVRDLRTNSNRQLTHSGAGYTATTAAQYPIDARFSSDGRQLAYGWQRGDGSQLRVISLPGGTERVITNNPEHEWLGPAGWSADGRRVLARVNTRGNSGQIAWVTLGTGDVLTLTTVPWTALGRVALSPDGRHIAYDQRSDAQPAARTIFVMAADGSSRVAVTDGSARVEVVGWLPKAEGLVFLSYRSGAPELWVQPFANGSAAGAAIVARRNVGAMQPIGITTGGTLYFSESAATGDAYIASVDWTTGRVGNARRINTNLTVDYGAAWSPDGSQIAYVGHRGADVHRRFIAVYRPDDGSTREVVPVGDLVIQGTGGNSWSPDGATYLLNGSSATHRFGTYAVDLRTGAVRTLATFASGYAQMPQWVNGGRELLYIFREQLKPQARLVLRDLQSGQERDIRHGFDSEPAAGFLLSPDERTLAFVAGGGTVPPTTLRLMPYAGGPAKTLVEVPGQNLFAIAWTPDSRHIVYSRTNPARNTAGGPRATNEAPERTLWVIAADGGESRQLHFPEGAPGIDIHPDGRQIAYTRTGTVNEVWAIDGLATALPASDKKP